MFPSPLPPAATSMADEDRVTKFPLSTQELHLFHKTDRDLFCFLIFKLRRDVTESLLVMALWFWLEHNGFPNLIHTFMPLAIPKPSLLNAVVEEAVACIACLVAEEFPRLPRGGGLTITKSIIRKEISMRLFQLKKHTAIAGIRSILRNTCSRVFSDLLHVVLKKNKTNTNNNNSSSASSSRASTSNSHTKNKKIPNNNLTLPGFPHPVFGEFNLEPQPPNLDLLDKSIWELGKKPSDDVTPEDRSMFLTFSKGFPVTDAEVMLLFVGKYGDVVENVTMGESDVKNQKLFAVLTLKDVVSVDRILRGQRIAKLHFNGKHIWARKFVFRYD